MQSDVSWSDCLSPKLPMFPREVPPPWARLELSSSEPVSCSQMVAGLGAKTCSRLNTCLLPAVWRCPTRVHEGSPTGERRPGCPGRGRCRPSGWVTFYALFSGPAGVGGDLSAEEQAQIPPAHPSVPASVPCPCCLFLTHFVRALTLLTLASLHSPPYPGGAF